MKNVILTMVACAVSSTLLSMDHFLEQKELARKNWTQKCAHKQVRSIKYQEAHKIAPHAAKIRAQDVPGAIKKIIYVNPLSNTQ